MARNVMLRIAITFSFRQRLLQSGITSGALSLCWGSFHWAGSAGLAGWLFRPAVAGRWKALIAGVRQFGLSRAPETQRLRTGVAVGLFETAQIVN